MSFRAPMGASAPAPIRWTRPRRSRKETQMNSITIVGVLVAMVSLNWNFTLVALSVTPLLAIFVYRLRAELRTTTPVDS